MPSPRAFRLAAILLRLGLGAGFVWAGVSKIPLQASSELAASIASFRLVPPAWVAPLADTLPFFEALTGCWLLLGWRPRAPALAAALLTAAFTLAAAQAALRGLDVSCACFGPAARTPLAWIIFRDCLWLAAALVVLRHARSAPRGEPLVTT